MTRSKLKRRWICKNNHPMVRTEGKTDWRCRECSIVQAARMAGKEIGVCRHGHARPVGMWCRVCSRYRGTPWFVELDATGYGTCSKGHPVSHFDESILYIKGPKGFFVRTCRACKDASVRKAASLKPDWSAQTLCRNKKHPKTPENLYRHKKTGATQCLPCKEERHDEFRNRRALANQQARGLPQKYVDWVVVERILDPDRPIGHLRRGTHSGPTDGERWVAYCTWAERNPGKEPLDLIDVPGVDPVFMYRLHRWRSLGKERRRGWKRVTLNQIRGMLDTSEYARNLIL